MTEAVVDRLEVIKVDEQHGQLAATVVERLSDLVREEGAVSEAGQGVVIGLMLELLLEDAQLEHRLLEPVVLQRHARVARQRVQQAEVVVVERAHHAEAVGEHDRADHSLLARQRSDHRVGDSAGLQVALQARAAERGVESHRAGPGALQHRAHLVGNLRVDGLH